MKRLLKKCCARPAHLRWSMGLFAFAVFGFCVMAQAQVTSSISGRVEDTSGAAIPGATVIVTSLETGAVRTAATDEAGIFRASSLPLGAQQVRVEKPGFKTAVRLGISLEVGQEAVVNLRMEVGPFAQQVTVSAEAPVVNTTTAPVSGVVGEREIKDLPLDGRSFDTLITLNPGTINYGLKSANTITSNGNTFAVAGHKPMDNLILLNGVEYEGTSQLAVTPGGVSGELLGIDAVREFNVLTDTYGAEYGKRSGAQVSVVTQSGSNVLHGTIYEFLRNNVLNSPGIFDSGITPAFRRNQFGAALGGPLQRNRLFLFGNYDAFRQSADVNTLSVVPDQQARAGLLPVAGVYTPVPNADPSIPKYMALWPQPNGPELLSNGQPTGMAQALNAAKQTVREDFGTTRLDYIPRDQDTFSGSYTIDDGTSLIPLADPLFASSMALRMQVASLAETHIFSPSMLNTARMGYSRAGFNFDSAPQAQFPSDLSFVTGGGPGGIVVGGGTTTTGAAAITSAGPNNAAGVWNRRNLFTYSDDLQVHKGRHEISVGVWFQRLRDNEDTASRQLGQASFTSLQTFLQGTVSTFQVVPLANELGWRSWYGAWYVQDTIKLRPNLTLEAGVRHEFTTGWNEVSGRAANYVTDSTGLLITNPLVGDSAFTQNSGKWLFAPRLGLAWDVFGNGKTAIRAGFGTYYSLIDALSFLLNSLPPANGSVSYATTSLASLLPVTPGVAPAPSCGPGVAAPCTIFAPQGVQANAQTPTVQEWSFAVEQQLTTNTALRVAYVGSHGYHGLLSIDPNSVGAQTCTDPNGCVSGGTGSARGLAPEGTQYIPVVPTRPNQYLSAGFFWFTEGNSSYNALELDLSHRLSRNLQFRANYTWSKNLDDNSGLTLAQSSNQAQMILNRNDVRLDWGPSALNATHQASISAHYDVPLGAGQRWLSGNGRALDRWVGGWQLNALAALLSGFPFTPQDGSNRSGDGDTRNPDRPSFNPLFTGPVILGTQAQWFNPNAFALPQPGTYGNVGRGVFTGPGLANVNLSILKNTSLSERFHLQFRAEFFNLFNRVNLGTPNAIVFSNGVVSGSAGLITTLATPAREVQFGLKLAF